MNWLQRLIIGKNLAQQLEKKAAIYQPGVRYAVVNGKIVTPVDNKASYIQEGYNKNDIIFSVINMVLDKVRLPEWSLYKVVKESSLKRYHAIMANKWISAKDLKKAIDLKYEALEPIVNFNLNQGKLKDLLKYPNETESFQDQVANGCGFKMLTGDMFMYGHLLSAGANKGIPQYLETLPSQYTIIKATDDFPMKASSYELMVFNQKFTKEEVLHEKYFNPNWSVSGEHLYGMAHLRAGWLLLLRNNAAKLASRSKFENGGMEDIIYMDDPRYTADQGLQQAQALKIKLAEEYSGPENQGKHAISGVKVGVAQLGMSPVDLGIYEAEKWDAIMFCNLWGVPPELLGLVNKTYNNVKEAEKALTTRSAIPLLNSREKSLNRKFQTDWGFKGQNVYVGYDTECFGELQTDMAEVVAATSKMMMVTPNEEREAAGWETRPEPEANEPWVLSGNGRVPLSDYQQNVIDQTLMNEAAINGSGNNENGNGKIPENGKGTAGLSGGNGKAKNIKEFV